MHRLAAHLQWPVLADGPSGCRREVPGVVTTFDSLVRHEPFAEAHRPEVVLRFGGSLASKALDQWLASSGALQIGLDPHGACPDPDRVLADSLHVDIAVAADQLRRTVDGPAPAGWRAGWIEADRAAREAIDRVITTHTEATEPGVAIDLAGLLSDGGTLVASSSMPVRDLEWFAPARDGIEVVANRGANGIDGVVSTAVGAALTGAPTALLIGDVAFLHDTNGLLGLMERDVEPGRGRGRQRRRRDLLVPAPAHGADRAPLRAAVRHAARRRPVRAGRGARRARRAGRDPHRAAGGDRRRAHPRRAAGRGGAHRPDGQRGAARPSCTRRSRPHGTGSTPRASLGPVDDRCRRRWQRTDRGTNG